jgi:hypothetical protein
MRAPPSPTSYTPARDPAYRFGRFGPLLGVPSLQTYALASQHVVYTCGLILIVAATLGLGLGQSTKGFHRSIPTGVSCRNPNFVKQSCLVSIVDNDESL